MILTSNQVLQTTDPPPFLYIISIPSFYMWQYMQIYKYVPRAQKKKSLLDYIYSK